MINKLFIAIFLTLLSNAGIGQENMKEQEVPHTHECEHRVFNIQEFNKNKNPTSKSFFFTLDDGSQVRQYEIEEGYLIVRGYSEHITNPPFETAYEYYKNGSIKRCGKRLYAFGIGTVTHYNNDGSIQKAINIDEPYLFSWQQMVEKIKNEYDIDLLTEEPEKQKFFHRTTNPYPYYTVRFYNTDGFYERMTFSGINGVMLQKVNEKEEIEIVNEPPSLND